MWRSNDYALYFFLILQKQYNMYTKNHTIDLTQYNVEYTSVVLDYTVVV